MKETHDFVATINVDEQAAVVEINLRLTGEAFREFPRDLSEQDFTELMEAFAIWMLSRNIPNYRIDYGSSGTTIQ